ncbi:MAG: SDR family oxidoreductase [Candidatus Micrarchaeia archaeon]
MAEAVKKVAVVTGGSQGIGKAMATAFGKAGHIVAICARTKPDVDKAAAELRESGVDCFGFALDVSDHAAVDSAFAGIAKKFGRIDVLVACAGVYGPIGRLEGNGAAEWEQAVRINLCGTAFAVRAVLPIMKRQGGGCIIAMAGGGVGGKGIKPNFSSYISSKFAICGFVEAVASELQGTGVRINAISPGPVNTRLMDQVILSGENAGKFYHDSLKQKETGGTSPELAAGFSVYLASGEASHISGKVLSVLWDRPESLARLKQAAGGSLYTLRRIDGVLFSEREA